VERAPSTRERVGKNTRLWENGNGRQRQKPGSLRIEISVKKPRAGVLAHTVRYTDWLGRHPMGNPVAAKAGRDALLNQIETLEEND
jgi:hypothetical protein